MVMVRGEKVSPRGRGNRIEPSARKRMAAQQPPDREPHAAQRAVRGNRHGRVSEQVGRYLQPPGERMEAGESQRL